MSFTLIHQLIWQASKIALLLTDRNLMIQEMHGLTEIINHEKHSCLGSSLLEVFPELLGNQQELEDILTGKLSSLKLEYINRETAPGRLRYLTLENLPYRDESNRIVGIAHLVQDVTDQGEVDQQLTQNRNELQLLKEQVEQQNRELVAANTELRHLSELKSQFISVAAHELRTPLTSLNGYLEMLLDGQMGSLTEKQRQVLEIIEKSGLRLVGLMDDLLNAARLEAGQIDLVLRPVDLAGLVKDAISDYGGPVQSKAQRLHLEVSPRLPPALCDATWAKQIVTNLLSNASKFTPEGGCISVTVRCAEQHGYLQLSVADTGVGIPQEDQTRIFSRWFRSKHAATVNSQGAGLGLYITHALVALHNGSIWLESQPDQGSVFHVTFPIAA
jgi:signal transduction histidine kinase